MSYSLLRLGWKAVSVAATHNEFCRHTLTNKYIGFLEGFGLLTLFLWLFTLLKIIVLKCLLRNTFSPLSHINI